MFDAVAVYGPGMRAAQQYLHYSDGSIGERPAGTFLFHKTHAHYHFQDILDYSIYRVGPGHSLTPAGHGTKAGFSPADQLFADWSTFSQEEGQFVERASTARSVGASTFGLSVGWGDVYRWQRPGQYVDFNGDGDGFSVVRVRRGHPHPRARERRDRSWGSRCASSSADRA